MQYGCIARKLGHSFSKTIHNMIGDYDYQLCELEPDKLSEFFQNRDFKAINVTIPYKQDVISYLDYTDCIAKDIGAVNTIVNKGGKLYGYNTDFMGMCALAEKMKVRFFDKKVAVLGTGGTSKTAAAVARHYHAKTVLFVSRQQKDGCITYDTLYSQHKDCDIIINTTPCGMYPDTDSQAVELSKLGSVSAVIDAVYNPLSSMLVQNARELGINAEGGLYMLVAQAVFAAEHFTGRKYGPGEIDRIYRSILKQKQNIVLIGMAGCGKSTLGSKVACRLGLKFYDTDDEIIKTHGEIKAIFEKFGEAHFRSIEKEVIARLCTKNGVVIATGGGAAIDPDNIRNLRKNAVIVFLDRALCDIPATADRPLSCDREKLTALYEKRYPIYKSVADIQIKITNDIEKDTEAIINECFN